MPYNPQKLEKKWQAVWEKEQLFRFPEAQCDSKPDAYRYVLDMFPYPSAAGLHVGHPRGYTATDILARFYRLQGLCVMHPIGFDSFGLPAENYALQTGVPPRLSTEANIARFKKQLKSLGFSYDWSREIHTHRKEYYRWTQWLFLQFYKKGLAYEAQTLVWYCPALKTVLANEEVLSSGAGFVSERGNHPVERRSLKQWMLKITDYAEPLLEGLEGLDWPASVKDMQRNWIGRSQGTLVHFTHQTRQDLVLKAFTTRGDTLFGVSAVVLAPEHPLVEACTEASYRESVQAYQQQALQKTELDRLHLQKTKTGQFLGTYVLHPLSQEALPLYVGDYVLMSYGTGVVMVVPAHDQRDFIFAQSFGLPIRQVVQQEPGALSMASKPGEEELTQAFSSEGWLCNSGQFDGLSSAEARKRIEQSLQAQKAGGPQVVYRLKDWVFSRQRYWGEPIPVIHCPACGVVPVPEEELPVELPELEDYSRLTHLSEYPLESVEEWIHCSCPRCGQKAQREKNTMPQWAGSCWYYLRYLDPHNTQRFADENKLRCFLPVNLYIGGTEHAVLHLLYARFWHRFLYDLGWVPTVEPFQKLVNQGMITAYTYRKANGALVAEDEVVETSEGVRHRVTGEVLEKVLAKMSKSLKNGQSPDEIIEEYGADTLRLYLMFLGPLKDSAPWNPRGLLGVYRFLSKVEALLHKPSTAQEPPFSLEKIWHRMLKKVGEDTQNLHFNTAIAQMMSFVNELGKQAYRYDRLVQEFCCVLSPYAPHLAQEMWQVLGQQGFVCQQRWPVYQEHYLQESELTVAIQINGKLRATVTLPAQATKEHTLKAARAVEKIRSSLREKVIVKEIFVPGKLVNFVVQEVV